MTVNRNDRHLPMTVPFPEAVVRSAAPVRVDLLALPEATPAPLYGLFEVLASVGATWSTLTGEPAAARGMAPRIVARQSGAFASAIAGLRIDAHVALGEARDADVVIVSDVSLPPDADPRGRWPAEAEWLRDRFAAGTTIGSVCTGSLVLAEAGLLDGEEATSHWSAAATFRDCYPAVRLRPERILCPAGPGHRLITSGGAASWGDLALYLIARLCGEPEAVRTDKVFLLGDRSEGQLPFSAMTRPRQHDDAVIGRSQVWIASHYAAPNPVARMVQDSGLPERTFKRRFKAATGYTPVDYVQALRVEEGRHLLETTAQPTDVVAHEVGYEDPAFFRRVFKRRTGTTPARYRQRFRRIADGP
jgi:transcriptional regulator GlxA family with amidase domain